MLDILLVAAPMLKMAALSRILKADGVLVLPARLGVGALVMWERLRRTAGGDASRWVDVDWIHLCRPPFWHDVLLTEVVAEEMLYSAICYGAGGAAGLFTPERTGTPCQVAGPWQLP